MANQTGDFDAVAQFAIPAVNRVLAAMHRSERFPHSLSLRVSDNAPPGTIAPWPSVVSGVDTSGNAIADQTLLGNLVPIAGAAAVASPVSSVLQPVVNPGLLSSYEPPVFPSHLQGTAQLQLSPPTIDLTDATGRTLTMTVVVRARYIPDPNTSPLTEFLDGELQLTGALAQIVSQVGNLIDVNLSVNQLGISFIQSYPAQMLSAQDQAALILLIRNALNTGFLPSSNPLPSGITHLQFKALTGNPHVLVAMLNLVSPNAGNPNTVSQNFLGAGDDWGFALSADYILGKIKFQPIPDQIVPLYKLSFKLPVVEFQPNRIVLIIKGHAEGTHSYSPPAFDFTVTQAFKLQLVSTTGGPLNTAELAADGDASIDPGYIGWLVDLFEGGAVQQQINDNLAQAQPNIRDALDVSNLGGFIDALLQPPDQAPGSPPPEEVQFGLAYTSWAISSSGIVLIGSLSVPAWPAVQVQFQQIPSETGSGPLGVGGVVARGPDYSALNSWIPGGTIQEFEWSYEGQAGQPYTDPYRFVLLLGTPAANANAMAARVGGGTSAISVGGSVPRPGVPAYTPLCLTVRGARLSSSGDAILQPASGSACALSTVPVVQGGAISATGAAPMLTLVQPGPGGQVEVVGHALAQANTGNVNGWNRIVHFADYKTASSLGLLVDGLKASMRTNASTVIIAVLTPDELPKATYVAGIIYAEERSGEWARAFGVTTSQRPLTLIMDPTGGIPWQQEGQLDSTQLAVIFQKYLSHTRAAAQDVLGLSIGIGQLAPNLLFPDASGQLTTLRKIAGRPVILLFCASGSKPSLQAALDLQNSVGQSAAGQGPILLVILDEEMETAKKVARENGLTATIVPDPNRDVMNGFGVTVWPTTVFLDPYGFMRSIRYGRS